MLIGPLPAARTRIGWSLRSGNRLSAEGAFRGFASLDFSCHARRSCRRAFLFGVMAFSPANVHGDKTPTPTSPDPAPSGASIVPARIPPAWTAPTPTPWATPSGGASNAQAHSSGDSRSPTPTAASPAAAPSATSPPAAPTATSPPAPCEPTVEASAVEAANSEPTTRSGVGGCERSAHQCDGQSNQNFSQHCTHSLTAYRTRNG
jgi:cytoskeletal protein RodZ